MLTGLQMLVIIAILAFGTAITRFLPFICFPNAASAPPYVHYLGKVLPAAAISLLVVYCFRAVELTAAPFGIPEAVSVAVIVALHIWKNNTLLCIITGTVIYMLLMQFVF